MRIENKKIDKLMMNRLTWISTGKVIELRQYF